MSEPTLIFFHGAGGYVDDAPLARGLAEARGAALTMPRLPDDDMSFEAWAGEIRRVLARAGPDDIVVAHSFGASILVPVLAEQSWPSRRATLLAAPDWSPAGWDVADYAYDGPAPAAALTLHHCRDDDVVPFSHLALWTKRLPAAEVVSHPRGGHQFDGLKEVLLGHL